MLGTLEITQYGVSSDDLSTPAEKLLFSSIQFALCLTLYIKVTCCSLWFIKLSNLLMARTGFLTGVKCILDIIRIGEF